MRQEGKQQPRGRRSPSSVSVRLQASPQQSMVHFSTATLALAALGATSALARNQLTFNLPSSEAASSIVSSVKHSVEGWVSEGVRKFDEITHDGLD